MVTVDESLSELQPLTRYMSFAKFVGLMRTSQLYFSSLATFAEIDPHEGSSTVIDALFESGLADALHTLVNFSMPLSLGTELSDQDRERLRAEEEGRRAATRTFKTPFGPVMIRDEQTYAQALLNTRRWLDASCWHMGEFESLAMWQTYGGSPEAVAVTTTVGRLARALKAKPGELLHLGAVRYIDHQEDYFNTDHVLAPALHKQRPYSYEQEVRAIVWNPTEDPTRLRAEPGRSIECDLGELVTGVRVSPRAQSWFEALVEQEVRGLGMSIDRSELARGPVFSLADVASSK